MADLMTKLTKSGIIDRGCKERRMKLQNKVLITIAFVWLLFASLLYLGSSLFITTSFLKFESDRANSDLLRIDQALEKNLNSLFTFTYDWAHWNDAYQFVQNSNSAFVKNNLSMTAFKTATLNLILYIRSNYDIIYSAVIDLENEKYKPYSGELREFIKPGSRLLELKQNTSSYRGYVSFNGNLMMVAAAPVTDGDNIKKPVGFMVTGRLINKNILQRIANVTKLPLVLYNLETIKADNELNTFFNKALQEPNSHYNKPLNENELIGFTIIRDIYQKPIAMLQTNIPRNIYQAGQSALHYFMFSFLALGTLLAITMLLILKRLIIDRLERLNHTARQISQSKVLTERVESDGDDELSSVARQINSMLDFIQKSHDQLELRVAKRTEELHATNKQLAQEINERKSIETELHEHKEHLIRLAHYDALTGLPNRALFNEILNKELANCRKKPARFAIFFIDLDRFKIINDTMGHHIGDLVLKEMATRIRSLMNSNDILARLGGDEFIILLRTAKTEEAINHFADAILNLCKKPININGNEFYSSVSIGISLYPANGSSLEDLQKHADMAMYQSKHAAKGQYRYFNQSMTVAAYEHVELDVGLRKAIAREEFNLHFQPKYEIRTGQIIGVEALLRWHHPELGIINPSKFLPIAEETGMIHAIGDWVMREACRACKRWQQYAHIPVAINLSPLQFNHKDLLARIECIMDEIGLPAHCLQLEVSETTIMHEVDVAIETMKIIHDKGIHFTIDDFGTGHTSISRLKSLPVSDLKIDRQFIKSIPMEPNSLSIVEAIISLAHSLDIHVIAAGVEKLEQLQCLLDYQCDYAQGYFLSMPITEDNLMMEINFNTKQISSGFRATMQAVLKEDA